MQVAAIIPARYASTRFPGKPLAQLGGKSMISRVIMQLKKTHSIHRIIVATDDETIAEHVRFMGSEVVMTSPDHPSGTDRCAEVARSLGEQYDLLINVQGDEPFIQPDQLLSLIDCFNDPATQIATLVKPITEASDIFNQNIVKVVRDNREKALYFSRSAIPFVRGSDEISWPSVQTFYRHLGVYAYTNQTLQEITALNPSSLEKAESLEQLRWLENGYNIQTVVTHFQSLAVDTPEDVENVEKFLKAHPEYL